MTLNRAGAIVNLAFLDDIQMTNINIARHLQINDFLTQMSSFFKEHRTIYAYEIEDDERYSVELDLTLAYPDVKHTEMRVGPDIIIQGLMESPKPALSFRLGHLSYQVKNLEYHRFVKTPKSNGYIFRSDNSWLVIAGSEYSDRKTISLEVDRLLNKMMSRKRKRSKRL